MLHSTTPLSAVKVNVALVTLVFAAGLPPVIVTTGATVSTVQV